MAKIFKIVNPSADVAQSYRRLVASGAAASIARGTPTKEGGSGAVAIMVDGDGLTSSDQRFGGIAKTTSTDTVSASGKVDVWIPFPGIIYAGKPKVSGAADTQAEIDALGGKRVVFDLTSSDWTVDTAASDSINNAVVIVGGQPEEDLIYFCVAMTTINYFENN